jgi:hypothetical protein
LPGAELSCGHFVGAFGREGAQPPPDLSPFRTGLFPVFTLLPVREGAGGEQPVSMDDGDCSRGHFYPIKGISRKRLFSAEKHFSLSAPGNIGRGFYGVQPLKRHVFGNYSP